MGASQPSSPLPPSWTRANHPLPHPLNQVKECPLTTHYHSLTLSDLKQRQFTYQYSYCYVRADHRVTYRKSFKRRMFTTKEKEERSYRWTSAHVSKMRSYALRSGYRIYDWLMSRRHFRHFPGVYSCGSNNPKLWKSARPENDRVIILSLTEIWTCCITPRELRWVIPWDSFTSQTTFLVRPFPFWFRRQFFRRCITLVLRP